MARIKDIKSDNPEYLIDVVEILGNIDPTNSNKYLPFLVKYVKGWVEKSLVAIKGENESHSLTRLYTMVRDFEELSQKNLLDNSDIYSYDSLSKISEAVKYGKEHVSRKDIKRNETVVILEDDDILIVKPLSMRSSRMYGSDTTWCTSSDQKSYEKYFTKHTKDSNLIYLINKKGNAREDRLDKVAFNYMSSDGKTTVWHAKDAELGAHEMMKMMGKYGGGIIDLINKELENKEYNSILSEQRGITLVPWDDVNF